MSKTCHTWFLLNHDLWIYTSLSTLPSHYHQLDNFTDDIIIHSDKCPAQQLLILLNMLPLLAGYKTALSSLVLLSNGFHHTYQTDNSEFIYINVSINVLICTCPRASLYMLPLGQTEVLVLSPLRTLVSTLAPMPIISNHLQKTLVSLLIITLISKLISQRLPSFVSFIWKILWKSNLYLSIILNF